jgi:hypothetical protein
MRTFALTLIVLFAALGFSHAGTERYSGKEMKQTAEVPCPEWYGDREWNFGIWGAYAFPGRTGERNILDVFRAHELTENESNEDDIGHLSNDRFLNKDNVWGGGGDIKYFWTRNLGVGVEGYALAGEDTAFGVLGTFTIRFPARCSRISPYLFWGVGAAFNGTHTVVAENDQFETVFPRVVDSNTVVAGQVGGGLEVRITRHIGWMADFSWNILDGSNNDFGMARTGLNFAF